MVGLRALLLLVISAVVAGCSLTRDEGQSCALPSDSVFQPQVSQSALDPERPAVLPNMALDEAQVAPTMLDAFRSAVKDAPPARVQRAAPRPIQIEVLSLSAGGQFGSFGAGFLRGWAENTATPRPQFDLVTGISAGGMLAPVAFGEGTEDAALEAFRGLGERDVFRRYPLFGLGTQPSLANPAPLEALLQKLLTPVLIDQIAKRHQEGARLLVMAVDLDSTRSRVFDLGSMAASDLPLGQRRDCMTEVMLASAAIPGLFPPRNIDGTLYADGGLREQIFLQSVENARIQVASETGRPIQVRATVVVNGSLVPSDGDAKDSLFGYIERSLVTLSDEVLRDSIIDTLDFAARNPNWEVRGLFADVDLGALCPGGSTVGTFDACVTQELFDHGRDVGRRSPIDFMTESELRALAEEF